MQADSAWFPCLKLEHEPLSNCAFIFVVNLRPCAWANYALLSNVAEAYNTFSSIPMSGIALYGFYRARCESFVGYDELTFGAT